MKMSFLIKKSLPAMFAAVAALLFWELSAAMAATSLSTSGIVTDSITVDTNTLYTDNVNHRVGVGTSTPEFKVVLDNDGGIIAKGTNGSGATLMTAGLGARLIWYPRKSAFRAGYVSGTTWDDANIGTASAALGQGTTASGGSSFASGLASTASGDVSTALGQSTTANGIRSTAMGQQTTASGWTSIAMGYQTTASGNQSTAMGELTTASGDNSTAIGRYLTAGSASNTVVIGSGVDNSNRLIDNAAQSLMVGFNSTIPTLFVGPASGVGTLGAVGIGDSSPASLFTVGSGDLFQVNASGNLVKVRNVSYSWPSSQGAATTVLTNDGAGNLSWSAGGGASTIDALSDAKTDSTSVFLGSGSGVSDGGGNKNTTVGINALNAVTAGTDDTAMGFEAGKVLTTGTSNSLLGSGAGKAITTGHGNTYLGYGAGQQNLAGSRNTFVGWSAGASYVGSGFEYNTVVGASAAAYGSGASYIRNTILGGLAGDQLTTGSNNVLVGYNAGFNLTTGGGNIIIGYNTDATSATAGNQLNIGNAIYGNLSTGWIGVGTTTPIVGELKLSVQGAGTNSNVATFYNSDATPEGIAIKLGSNPVATGDGFVNFYSAAGFMTRITGDGAGGVVYNTSSDARLKENVVDTRYSLADLMKIRVADFNFKSAPGKTTTGVIAQDLYGVYPPAVSVGGADPATDPWGVDYGRLTPLLIKAVQDQQKEIEDLKALVCADHPGAAACK